MFFILKSIYKINPGTNNIKLQYLNKLCRDYGKQVVFKNFEFVISDTHTIIALMASNVIKGRISILNPVKFNLFYSN